MPQGTYIPVFTTERLKFKSGGRGLVIDDDATNFDIASWTGICSTGSSGKKFLPAASATAWWKVKDDTGNSYYLPLYNCKF